jgi:predicted nucleotidyltransferase
VGKDGDPLPIFRSGAQREILVHFFVTGTEGPLSLSALGETIGISRSTLQREVEILDRAGVLTSRRIGNTRLVTVNEASPFRGELQALLVKAYGPAKVLGAELGVLPGVERALIFGSWARRYAGEAGNPPHDIDVLVVGSPSVQAVYRAARATEDRLGIEVNPVVAAAEELERPAGLIERVLSGPTIELELGDRG